MNALQRRELLCAIPWVRRTFETNRCIGFLSGTPLKAVDGVDAVELARTWTCKCPARWHFTALPPAAGQAAAESGFYCMSHLINRCLSGVAAEERRYRDWLHETGRS